MGFFKKKTVKVWAGVNKDGKLSLHAEQPVKNEETGRWESKLPFVNSVMYKELSAMFAKTEINFDCPCQFFEINV